MYLDISTHLWMSSVIGGFIALWLRHTEKYSEKYSGTDFTITHIVATVLVTIALISTDQILYFYFK